VELASTIFNHQDAQPVDWRSAGLAFHSLNFFCRKKFGARVWKISVDAGCGCPNRDGTLGTLGCAFCDPESFSPSRRLAGEQPSGDWSIFRRENAACEPAPTENMDLPPSEAQAERFPSVADQIELGIRRLTKCRQAKQFLAYFQPATNTYGPIDRLRRVYEEAVSHPQVVGLLIGTRPDCVSDEVLDLLAELAGRTWLVVEYGLQTIHDRTLDLLNRGHHYDAFLDAYRRSRRRNLNVGVHVILGLPGESRDDMRATAQALAQLDLHSVKPHNLYAVRNTRVADDVAAGRVRLPEFSEYVGYLVDFLERLPGRFVIERLCGDAPPRYLVGPSWCLDKGAVRSAVDAEFRRRGTWQGSKMATSE
jgi:radical SAM protein (TIGR01212 family)